MDKMSKSRLVSGIGNYISSIDDISDGDKSDTDYFLPNTE